MERVLKGLWGSEKMWGSVGSQKGEHGSISERTLKWEGDGD